MGSITQHHVAWTYYQLFFYGLLWTIGHLKIEHITLIKPLQYGMHTLSEHLIIHEHNEDNFTHTKGLFINALKLAQRGFNDLFWDLFLYFFPVFVQTLITVIIFWWCYGLFYALSLAVGVCGYICIAIKNAQWTIETRKKYNEHDTHMISYLSLHAGHIDFDKHQILHIVQNRRRAALDKDLRDFYAHSMQCLIAGVGLTALLLFSGHGVFAGRLSLADFLVIKSYLLQIVVSFTKLNSSIHSMQKSLTNIEHIFDLIKTRRSAVMVQPARSTDIHEIQI